MSLRIELFSADLSASADFYARVLGFRLDRDERAAAAPYLALSRDSVRLGVAARPAPAAPTQRRPPGGAEVVLEVDDVDAERRRVADAGWPVLDELTAQPWGLRDFRVLDPDGWYLRLTDRPA